MAVCQSLGSRLRFCYREQAPSHILIRVSLLRLSATEMLSLQVVLGVASRRKAQKLGAAVLN